MLATWIAVVISLPLAMVFLERIGGFTVQTHSAHWRPAIVVIAIVAMILTPEGDPKIMLRALALLSGSYLTGAWLCKWLARHQAPLT